MHDEAVIAYANDLTTMENGVLFSHCAIFGNIFDLPTKSCITNRIDHLDLSKAVN